MPSSKPAVQARWYLAFYVLIALAVLTKVGPVGIVLPALILARFCFTLGNAGSVGERCASCWAVLVLAIALP